jgi:membrane protease YdiL (CAAX protease family)
MAIRKSLAQNPNLSALLEVGVMFLPAIPAYIWIWPNIQGVTDDIFQIIAYLYVLAGTLFIGLRRWNLEQLGLNRRGIGLALACTLVLLGGRTLIILSMDWRLQPPGHTLIGWLGQALYYFGLVGLVEELLFRGLLYRLLLYWRGLRWAIWGTSIGFGLWHIFGQGPIIGMATFVIGLVYALIRWRAGGIVGLVVLHGLWDLQSALMVADSNAAILSSGRPDILQPMWVGVGMLLLIAVPLALWRLPFKTR